MWRVIYMTNTRDDAVRIEQLLLQDGFLVKIKSINKNNPQGICEILVPQLEAEEAYMVLMQHRL